MVQSQRTYNARQQTTRKYVPHTMTPRGMTWDERGPALRAGPAPYTRSAKPGKTTIGGSGGTGDHWFLVLRDGYTDVLSLDKIHLCYVLTFLDVHHPSIQCSGISKQNKTENAAGVRSYKRAENRTADLSAIPPTLLLQTALITAS